LNFSATTVVESNGGGELSGIELYLIDARDRSGFTVTKTYRPYFYVATSLRFADRSNDVAATLLRRFDDAGMRCNPLELEDLDVPNHVTGTKRTYLKLDFDNVSQMMNVRSELLPRVRENQARCAAADAAASGWAQSAGDAPEDVMDTLTEIREYDVAYTMRCAIDLDIRVGAWLDVQPTDEGPIVSWRQDVLEKAEPRVLAFDIECTKSPLKFPSAERDEIFMISYMVDGTGFLIISRTVVAEDIDDFEYSPKPQFPGPFAIFNEVDEVALLKRFCSHVRELKPHVFVTYNGDFFDWPFLERRLTEHGMDLYREVGIRTIRDRFGAGDGEYRGRATIHLDAFYWVKRDSYLPQGSQGLKAVTKCKLGYDPVEVDPEDMVKFAQEQPAVMAAYSVSDAVATFYLYETYVHLFIFSLCTIIPNGPEDVLRKGSGTLCEALLMVQAFKAGVVCPNKQQEPLIAHHDGHMIETETYVGGHVESLETGVYRSDLAYTFKLVPAALQKLIDCVDRDLTFVAEVEGGVDRSDLANYDQVRNDIIEKLEMLRDAPNRREQPAIYHLDVGAMYPNIILTNRLQPTAVVSRETCASCDYNDEVNNCKRPLDWIWRGELNPAKAAEFAQLRRQLQYERVADVPYHDLPQKRQAELLRLRARDYSQKVYKKTKVSTEEHRTDVTCMRENSFYIDTVRAFRDRRYEYKALTKRWKKARSKAESEGDASATKKASDKELLFESLQVAHKCILNSFYGYVMRKGARWRSMPMAGIVTLTGANLITQARELVEKIGRPLELDTDGIWCILPKSFPDNYELKTRDGSKTVSVHYACAMLNADVAANYTNHQYQNKLAEGSFSTSSECSIFFEVDGPYRCMVLPSSTEEGKLLKKRYAVFNHDGTLAELKGFELKRRGELELIKAFQGDVFAHFLKGDSLETCYAAVADVANNWLDVLDSHGRGMDSDELLDLISENRSMSKELSEYGGRKMTAVTTANRLADFLGDEMVKDKGLQCKLIISSLPRGAPVTERAVPTAIFKAEPAVRRHFLRKWLRDPSLRGDDFRDILDWDYYRDRLANVVRKIITIPAALQGVSNPVPRVEHPDWLKRVVRQRDDGRTQTKIDVLFARADKPEASKKQRVGDIESMCDDASKKATAGQVRLRHKALSGRGAAATDDGAAGASGVSADAAEGGAKRRAPQARDGFEAWLSDRKERWRAQRSSASSKNPKSVRTLAAAASTKSADRKRPGVGSVTEMLRQSAAALQKGVWRVLEVRETDVAGEFQAFIVTELGHVHRVNVAVPRVFYAELRSAEDSAKQGGASQESATAALVAQGGRRVKNWHTPRAQSDGAKGRQLFEVRLKERRFCEHPAALAQLLAHPELDAAYELETPLWFTALLTLGAGAKLVGSAAQVSSAVDKLGVADIEIVSADAAWRRAPLRTVFVYHSFSQKTRCGIVFVAYLKPESGKPTIVLFIVDPRSTRNTKPPPLKSLFAAVHGLGSDAFLGERQDDVLNVERADVFKDLQSAFVQASASLASYIAAKNGPTVAVVQSSTGAAALRRRISALADLPNVEMAADVADSAYPVLGWQNACTRKGFERLADVPIWLEEQQDLALFANLPLGNVGETPLVRVADVAFARLLRKHRHLLWASESPKPDMGTSVDFDEAPADCDFEKAADVVDTPGVYRNVCVQVDVFGLAVDAVMVSEHLDDEDVDVGRAPAFRLLRALVADWIGDVANRQSAHADALLVGLYRWVCCRSSLLYSPALRRCVRDLMRRVHSRLVAELRRLGVVVVHASFHKMILATTKSTLESAMQHVDYLLQTLSARPIFQYVTLRPTAWYTALVFVDRYNFGALEDVIAEEVDEEAPAPDLPRDDDEEAEYGDDEDARGSGDGARRGDDDGARDEEDEGDEEDAGDDGAGLEADDDENPVWGGRISTASSAPPAVPLAAAPLAAAPLAAAPLASDGCTEHFVSRWSLAASLPALAKDYFVVFVGALLRDLERSLSTGRLLAIANELKRRRVPDDAVCHFVVLTCHVLSLDASKEEQLATTRRTLLASISVREFSEKSNLQALQAPGSAGRCILADAICSSCHACADVDLLHASDESEGEVRCAHCDRPYDLLEIELELVEQFNQFALQTATQDVHCAKCRKVATTTMSTMCGCSGAFVPAVKDDHARQRLAALRAVSEIYDMPVLAEIVSAFKAQ